MISPTTIPPAHLASVVLCALASSRRAGEGPMSSRNWPTVASANHFLTLTDALPRLLGCADEARRPLPRGWLLAGAARSGTPVHDHPLTCAYVVLLSGCKLWAVLPPGTDRSSLFPTSGGDYDLSAADWFLRWDCGPPPGARIFVQKPREVVFVPAGWWHVVLNASDNVALSRSLALERDFAFLDAGPATALERDRAEALRAARNGGDNCV